MSKSPSEPKAKRRRVDKVGRFAALEKLRSLKGQKNKYELEDKVDNVYDIVDEKEFASKAREKFGSDWIDDDGTGYVEDGRDFFEDEDDYVDEDNKRSGKSKNSKKKPGNDSDSKKTKGSIRNLFRNAMPKKKDAEVKLIENDILKNFLEELDDNPTENGGSSAIAPLEVSTTSTKTKEDSVKEYMQTFKNFIKKKDERKENNDVADDEIIERIIKKPNLQSQKESDGGQPPKAITESITIKKPESPKSNSKSGEGGSMNMEIDDMDFSILDADENQFEKEELISTETPKDDSASTKIVNETEVLLNNWDAICKMDNFEEEIVHNNTEDDLMKSNQLHMWYWDAWEDGFKRPGEVFLFGKVQGSNKDWKSVCVHVQNIERVLYLLPREYMWAPITHECTKTKVTLLDVYNEFNNTIANQLQLTTFRSKKVTKNFAFHVPGVDIPASCEYLEVRYEGKKPTLSSKQKYNSIAHIFGTNTSALERFILERKLKGPCWLNITKCTLNTNPLSWCKLEAVCTSPHSVSVAEDKANTPPPPINVLSINVRTALDPKTMKNEVVMISCLVNNKFRVDKPPSNPPFNRHFCGFSRPSTQIWPLDLNRKLQLYKSTKTVKLDTERALLSWFLATYQSIDPDLIVTNDANDCQLDIICDRIATLKIPMWSRLGRLKFSQITSKKIKDFFIGRLICDVKLSAEELIKSRSYDLDTLCTNVLKLKEGERMDVSNDDLHGMYESGDSLMKLITLTMQDCSYILRLMCELNVIPLALQITNVCGNLMSRTLQGGRSERNEFLLLHAFTEKNYIVPDKKIREMNWNDSELNSQATQTAARKKKAAYSGGLVLDPIKGLYDKFILLMDFNSLYPSIIQEYNICFTTIPEPENETDIPPLPDASVQQGVLPRQIRRLVESRREVKKLMAASDLEADKRMQYNIRQLALKLTANSMYGCLGFSQSRFFAQHLAALVTYKGREILMNTKSLVQKLNFEVIYGDTDSIMVNTNCNDYDQVFKIGNSIKQSVNKIYKQIELEIDGVFKYLLLLKKKKYAAVVVTKNKKGEICEIQEHKGLDIVRRDWSQISVMAGKVILDDILSDNPLDEKIDNIHVHLEKIKQNILDGTVPLPMLTITKQLTKNPGDYTNVQTLPHVQVALRMNKTRNTRYKRGDMVSYIICDDGTEKPPMQRAYHLDELTSSEILKADTMYYLAHQIHPVVSRLCEPLEGTDASRIAGCLGLDPNKFKSAAQKIQRKQMDEDVGASVVKTAHQKFRFCEKFKFICVRCQTENIVASAFKPIDNDYVPALLKCSNKDCLWMPYQNVMSIRNQLILAIRSCVGRFYENWLVCDDPACNNNTRSYSHVIHNNRCLCFICKRGFLIRQYSEKDLFNQISYYQYIFDIEKTEHKNQIVAPEIEYAYNVLKETVDKQLEISAYSTISLSKLFRSL